jgi:hypothetical protein
MTKLRDYLNSVDMVLRLNENWRAGQAMYNVLATTEPKLAPFVTGSDIDPYNNDRVIPKFLDKLVDYWSEDGAF